MIPEAYWNFLGRWWWLMLIGFAAGCGLAYLWMSNAPVEFRSSTTIELNYMRDITGKLFLDEAARRSEASRLALELDSVDRMTKLKEEVRAAGFRGNFATRGEVNSARVDILPPGGGRRGDPPYIRVVAHAGEAENAQWLARKSAEIAARMINERYDSELEERHEFWNNQIAETSEELKSVLQQKREIIGYESGLPELIADELAKENTRLISELVLVLSELREESSRLNVEFGADTAQLDQKISELTQEVQVIGDTWETRLKRPLETLYAIEAQPDYQFALMREELIRNKIRENAAQLNALTQDVTPKDQATIIASRPPEPVLLLGLRRRYIVGAGGITGLLFGWLLANLGENLLNVRNRRRERQMAHAGATS